MIIDVNASLGHFAFRRLRHNTSDGLLRLMDSRKIDRAVVAAARSPTVTRRRATRRSMMRPGGIVTA